MYARDIDINGIVQGVGFRPFVARLARGLGLAGSVVNAPDGVRVHVEAERPEVLDEFERRIIDELPPAARVVAFDVRDAVAHGCEAFVIEQSEHDGAVSTLVSPDLATCPDCERELFDPENRRYHYPFINCTNCGPRFTIIEELPYDRPVTSMREFAMCPQCQGEYDDETDRRYHAQPNACFACGPQLWWTDAAGFDGRGQSDALIARAAERLLAGDVIAVKGLGGWHLACDATNDAAVAKLRERKHRPTKPLAVMCSDLDMARTLARVDSLEADLLSGSVRPIVLLIREDSQHVTAETVCCHMPEIGVMLPSTPVQHLLLRALARPLVMTSGNMSGEPIVADDAEALEKLGHIADGFLGNNRKIVARYDDSVVRVLEEQEVQIVRRARGYAPMPLFVQNDPRTPVIFAAGSEQKATFALLDGERAYLSQHLGDLETAGAWRAYREAYERYTQLFDLTPQALACDMHPEYLSSKWARELARDEGWPLVEVQHHHAHVAAVMGENSLYEPVIGVAIDGTGYGEDGAIWGGEVLIADRARFERVWHFPQFRLPGGAAAIKRPRRTAYALLVAASELSPQERAACGLQGLTLDNPQWAEFLAALDAREMLDKMIERGLNSPACTSLGRIFDAVAALMGLVDEAGFEGEPACLLEAAARGELASAAQQSAARGKAGVTAGDGSAPLTAYGFHKNIANAIIRACEQARERSDIARVALGGGCMANRLLAYHLRAGLADAGFDVYENHELPPNDGCISFGQAIVAAARLREGS